MQTTEKFFSFSHCVRARKTHSKPPYPERQPAIQANVEMFLLGNNACVRNHGVVPVYVNNLNDLIQYNGHPMIMSG